MSSITDVLNGLSSASLWQERVYKDLHAHPELSFHETRTAALAAAKLKELGYEVLEHIGRTGVVGVLRNGTVCLPLIRPIASRRPPKVFVMEPTHAWHLHYSPLNRPLDTPRLGRVLTQR